MRGKSWKQILACGAMLMLGSTAAIADTFCKAVPGEHVRPDQRESSRSVHNQVLPTFIQQGDSAAAAGRLAEAASSYFKVFRPFMHNGINHSFERCADASVYQEAADKLRAVAGRHAEHLMAEGHYLPGDSPVEANNLQGGALHLLLISNAYDEFIDHSFDYAVRQLRERDIYRTLEGMASRRVQQIEYMRDNDFGKVWNLDDDTTPLLAEELAGIDKFAGFEERLRARLAPLYPKITDYWLATEDARHRELVESDNAIQQTLRVDNAAGALSQGIRRLREHPREIERLKARGSARGEAFMSRQEYALARPYFDAVGNDDRQAQADELAKRDEAKMVRELKGTLQADIEKMQKTEEESAEFEDDTEDMAAEFGFDLGED